MLEVAIYILAFVAFSGFMAMIDAAVLSVSRAEVEEMVQRNKPGAMHCGPLWDDSHEPS